jgi:hypothetical protein
MCVCFPVAAAGVRTVDSLYKLKICIQIAMLYLEDDDPVSAETFIKKASSLIAGAKDPELELQYKTSYARIMDAKRRWEGGDTPACAGLLRSAVYCVLVALRQKRQGRADANSSGGGGTVGVGCIDEAASRAEVEGS